ncbi:MAG: heavy-metal-associated domain-containing protein [Cetobacterium sp.]|nr:heavy-metal-associated domain-containing protein [Cetobacterium sp.]
MIKTYKLLNVKCNSCVKLIEMTLKDIEGITSATVDLNSKLLTIDFDPNIISEEKWIEELDSIGHGIDR